jgi:hypothetical protein
MTLYQQVQFPNVAPIISIGPLVIYPRNDFDTTPILFDNIVLEEDMFNESMFGSLSFYDSSPNLYYANQINFNNVVSINLYGRTRTFDILDVSIATDLSAKTMTVGPVNLGNQPAQDSGKPTKVIVRFASKLFAYNNYYSKLDNDFIGFISSNGSRIETQEVGVGLNSQIRMSGFVQELAAKAGIQVDAHNTYNSVWIKHDPSFYPFSKLGSNLRVSQVMNYVAEYACKQENKDYVDFFFWEDWKGWHFKSISKMAQQDTNYKFQPTTNENDTVAIASFEVINAVSPTKLAEGGAFFGEYVRIKPNWDTPYIAYTDTSFSIQKRLIKYDFITGYRLGISNNGLADLYSGAQSNTVRITDTNYGFSSNPYNSTNSPWWNYEDNYNQYTGDQSLVKQPDRLEKTQWRAQFDFCELPATPLKVIYEEIKWDETLLENKRIYAEAKRAKEMWKIFRESGCCVRNPPETFFAVLTGAKKIYGSDGENGGDDVNNDSGGIWAYDWVEIEFWPREDAREILKDDVHQIIDFEDGSFPFVFIKPKGAAFGMAPAGRGFSDSRAYNLNEILNSRVPKEYEVNSAAGNPQPPWTLTMNPGITDTLGLNLKEEDEEKRKEYTSYPKNFAMMPVGKFRIIDSEGGCPPDWDDTGSDTSSTDFYFGGKVVQMYKIPRKSLTGIVGATEEYINKLESIIDGETIYQNPTEYLYMFDAENAHDGICTDCGSEV